MVGEGVGEGERERVEDGRERVGGGKGRERESRVLERGEREREYPEREWGMGVCEIERLVDGRGERVRESRGWERVGSGRGSGKGTERVGGWKCV